MSGILRTFLAVIALSVFTYSSVGGQDMVFEDSFEIRPARLVHRWTFSDSGGSGTSLIDDIGGAHGMIVNGGVNDAWVGYGELKISGGARDSSDYAALPAGILSGRNSASIELWATQESVQTWGRIFDVGDSMTNSLLMTWDFSGDANNDRMQWNSPYTNFLDGAMAPYVLGTEYHIVMTIERDEGGAHSSLVRLYRDGVFQGERQIDHILADLANGDFLLARSRFINDPTANSSYNEIRIYNGVLTDTEIAGRFSAGPVADKVTNQIYIGSISNQPVGWDFQVFSSVFSSGGPISQQVIWTSSNPAVATVSSSGRLTAKGAGVATISVRSVADPSLTASTNANIHQAWPYLFWNFNETGDSGTILNDSLSQDIGQLIRVGGHDSSVGGGRVSLVGGNKDEADYVKLGNYMTYLQEAFSIEMWASTNSAKAWSRIFDFGPDTSNYLMMSWTQFADPATDRIEMRRNGVTAFTADNTMGPYVFGVEYHIVMTVDEGGGSDGKTLIKWYRNGVKKGQAETTAIWSDLRDDTHTNWLGRSKYPDETANASYNEFKVYQGVMTDAEITARYNEGPTGGGALYSVLVSGPISVEKGKTIQMSATVNSTAGAISQAVNWTSNNPTVAWVNSSGLVTGMAVGVAEIRATSQIVPSASGVRSVTVTPQPPLVGVDAVLYSPISDQFVWFRKNEYTIQTWGQPFPEGKGSISANWSGWPAGWGPGDVDAAVFYPGNQKIYLFKGSQYSRHSIGGAVDSGYPVSIVGNWTGWPPTWGSGDVDAVVYDPDNEKVYLFKDNQYSRSSWGGSQDGGYPVAISGNWAGWPGSWGAGGVDAVTYYPGNKKFYLFKGYEFARHSFAGALDSGYPKSFNEWKSSPPQAAFNVVSDFANLKTGWTTQQWDGIGFPDSWADSRGLPNHIQGVTQVHGGRWVFSHSRDGDPGFLIGGFNNDFTFYTWNNWADHPGSIQASGSIVAVPFTNPQDVRFVQFGANSPVELTHLKVLDTDNGQPNSVGLAFYPPHNAYYMIIGITPNRTEVKGYPLYKSHYGKSLLDPTNRFDRMGLVNVEGSETGMQLVFDEQTQKMHLLTLYRGDGDGLLVPNRHRAVLSRLEFPGTVGDQNPNSLGYPFSSTEVNARQNFDISGGIFTDPTFRFGAGALITGSGRLNLVATERCIPPIYFWMQSCLGDGNGLDYFILKP